MGRQAGRQASRLDKNTTETKRETNAFTGLIIRAELSQALKCPEFLIRAELSQALKCPEFIFASISDRSLIFALSIQPEI